MCESDILCIGVSRSMRGIENIVAIAGIRATRVRSRGSWDPPIYTCTYYLEVPATPFLPILPLVFFLPLHLYLLLPPLPLLPLLPH